MLAGSLPLASSATFLTQSRPTCPGMELPTVGRSLLHPLRIMRKCLTDMAEGNLIEATVLIDAPSSQVHQVG